MSKSLKPLRRNLNDAFITVSDDENIPSDESASASGTSYSLERHVDRRNLDKKSLGTKKKVGEESSFRESFYSTEYSARNCNFQSLSEFHPENDKARGGVLKRSGSLAANSEPKNKKKHVRFAKGRRSLESNLSPLVDISSIETPEFIRFSRRSNFGKTSEAKHSREKERIERNTGSNNLKARKSYPESTTASLSSQTRNQYNEERNAVLEAGSEVPENVSHASLQSARNLTGWRRKERTTVESYTNQQNLAPTERQERSISIKENEKSRCSEACATNGTERNVNCQFASSTQNLAAAAAAPYCCPAPRSREDFNKETHFCVTQELSEIPNCCPTETQQIRNEEPRPLSRFEEFLNEVGKNHDFLNPNPKNKLKYYERSKIDLVEIEGEGRNEVNTNNLNSASTINYAWNIECLDKCPQQRNFNESITENWQENVFIPESKFQLESLGREDSPERQINQFPTAESPISSLMNKNLTELNTTKVINK